MSEPKSKKPQHNPEVALQVLSQVESRPDMSQRAMAAELGISLGSVNFCLKALIDKGFVKAQNFRKSENKMGYAYLLTPAGMHEKANLTIAFLKRKQVEYHRLEKEIAELQRQVDRLERREDL